MPFASQTDVPSLVEEWPYDFQYIEEGDDLWDFLSPFAQELRYVDALIDEFYEQRFFERATGRELEKLAAEVGVTRREGEDDDTLRFRARIRKFASTSHGTPDDIAAMVAESFEDKDISIIEVEHDPGHPVTRFRIPQPYLDDIPLSQSEYEEELNRAYPAGHAVNVRSMDVFLFGESGAQGLGNGDLI